MRLRIKITFETEHLLVLRKAAGGRGWCEECRGETDFVATPALDELLPNWRGKLDAGNLHTRAAANGELTICLNSLLKD